MNKSPDHSVRFHWSMSSAGAHLKGAKSRDQVNGIPDVKAHIEFCEVAARNGIEHLLTAFGFHRSDPIALAAALGMVTDDVNFLIAVRSGVASPTLFVQQINSLSTLINGRVCINVVAGHSPKEFRYYGDFLEPDLRYDRTDEFLTICRSFWENDAPVNFNGKYYQVENGQLNTPFVSGLRTKPEIYLGGSSNRAIELAKKHADCLLTFPDKAEILNSRIQPLKQDNIEIGLISSILARPSREEALHDAYHMLEQIDGSALKTHKDFKKGSVSQAFNQILEAGLERDWLGPNLWTGAVPYLGAPAIAIIGSYDEVAATIIDFKNAGISQFLFMGWPDIEEMNHFGSQVLPRVRKLEKHAEKMII